MRAYLCETRFHSGLDQLVGAVGLVTVGVVEGDRGWWMHSEGIFICDREIKLALAKISMLRLSLFL